MSQAQSEGMTMALLEVVEAGHHHVADVRHELDNVRQALDRTDAVLGVADDALLRAESGIATSRHLAPYVLVGLGVAVGVVVAIGIVRRRRRRSAL